jgi:hypothetical protein
MGSEMTLPPQPGDFKNAIGCQLGWGFRVQNFQGFALIVEITFDGCVYVVLDLASCSPVVEAHSDNSETGKIAAVSAILHRAFGRGHGRDPMSIARALPWYQYPI